MQGPLSLIHKISCRLQQPSQGRVSFVGVVVTARLDHVLRTFPVAIATPILSRHLVSTADENARAHTHTHIHILTGHAHVYAERKFLACNPTGWQPPSCSTRARIDARLTPLQRGSSMCIPFVYM